MQSLTLNGVLRKQGFRMLSCTRVACIRPQHPAELFDDLRAVESCHGGVGHLGAGGLLDPEVMLGKGSYLRQVGDAEDLSLLAEPTQLLADRPRGVAADSGVDLVEHQRAWTAHG